MSRTWPPDSFLSVSGFFFFMGMMDHLLPVPAPSCFLSVSAVPFFPPTLRSSCTDHTPDSGAVSRRLRSRLTFTHSHSPTCPPPPPPLPELNLNSLKCHFNFSHRALTSAHPPSHPPIRHAAVGPPAVPVRLLVVTGGPSQHQSLCQPDAGQLRPLRNAATSLHLRSW